MGPDEAKNDGQTKSASAGLAAARAVGAVKRSKMSEVLGRDAYAGVGDLDRYRRRPWLTADADRHGAVRRGVVQRVRHQVADRLADAYGVRDEGNAVARLHTQ